jgi:hypothetical protein
MSSDLDARDHLFDSPAPPPDAPRSQDFTDSQRDAPAPEAPAPLSDATPSSADAGDAVTRNTEQTATSDVQHFKIRDAAGHEYMVTGDPEGCRKYAHQQGDNDLGFKGTCGLCSVQDVADQFGLNVTENDVVHYAKDHNLCSTDGPPEDCGGTDIFTQAQILSDMHIMAQPFQHMSVDDLAKELESGHKIILEVNAGELFQGILPDNICAQVVGPDPHAYNHAIVVTGVVHDPQTGQVIGVYINDTGANLPAQFIDRAHLEQAWVGTGGQGVAAYGPVGSQPAAPPGVVPQTVTPQQVQPATPGPLTLPHITPRGDAPGNDTATPEQESSSAMPAFILPLVAIAALRARTKPKPKN